MTHPSIPRRKTGALLAYARRATVACSVVCALVGCQVIVDVLRHGRRVTDYPHDVHLGQEALECEDCHDFEDSAGLPTFPLHDDCADCHNEPGDNDLLAAYFHAGEGRWAHAGRQREEIILAHAAHTSNGKVSCRECHEDVASSAAIWSDVKMRMQDCVDCHRRTMSEPEKCSTCHQQLDRQVRPRTHDTAFMAAHGERWRVAGGDATVDQCSLCHTQGSCDDCHLTQRPRDHNQHWRGRGHGLLAGMDRSRCAVCHTRDTCDRCHSRERPRSHRSAFGGTRNSHCLGCHLPLGRGNDCAVCHFSTPSHDAAQPLPANAAHRFATEAQCRECHFPPPHVDNGDACRFCHR